MIKLLLWPFMLHIAWSQFMTNAEFEQAQRQRTIDEIVQACRTGQNRTSICEMIVEIQQLGIDSVETLKAFIPMNRYTYFTLTVVNMVSSGRVRLELPSLAQGLRHTVELRQTGESLYFFSYQF